MGLFSFKSIFVVLFCLIIFTFTGCPGGTSFFSLEAPQNLTVDNVYSDVIELSWDSQSSVSGYILYISLDDTFENAQAIDVSKNNVVGISGFQSSTTYYFRVTAYTYSSESDPSEMVSATTLVGGPQSVTISFSNNDLSLNWDAVPRATGYKIFYGLSSEMEENPSREVTVNNNNGTISTILTDVASNKGLYNVWVFGKDENSISSTYAYGIKRKGSPNYKFHFESGPTSKSTKNHSLETQSEDTQVFLIKVNRDGYSVSKDRTGGVTKVNNNYVGNSEKKYAKYSISGKAISRSAESTPTFLDESTVLRLDHLPSKQKIFDINNMKSVTSRSGTTVQSRAYSQSRIFL